MTEARSPRSRRRRASAAVLAVAGAAALLVWRPPAAAAVPVGGDLTGSLPAIASPSRPASPAGPGSPSVATNLAARRSPAGPPNGGNRADPNHPAGPPGGVNGSSGATGLSGASANASVTEAAAVGAVAVPQPTPLALRRFRTGNRWWLVELAWSLAVPAAWLWSGLSARLRRWTYGAAGHWVPSLLLYFAVYTGIGFLLDLPLAFYLGFVREHAYGLSTQSAARWWGDTGKALALSLAGGAALIWTPYLLLRSSPRRWWLYAGLSAVPVLLVVTLVAPLWIDPLFNRYTPLADHALERDIAHLAARGGIAGSRILEVDMSADTRALNATVDGFAGTQRIVLWDTLLRRLDRRETLFVVGHEMGHFVLGHTWLGIGFFSCLILAALYLVERTAGRLLARCGTRFGFDQLADFASLPLLELLLGAFLFLLAPLALGFSRHLEHEADRFGLELTHDNRAAALALVKLQQDNLSVPRPGPLYELWRGSHPALGDRIDFANSYRPWQTGQPERYGDLFDDAAPALPATRP